MKLAHDRRKARPDQGRRTAGGDILNGRSKRFFKDKTAGSGLPSRGRARQRLPRGGEAACPRTRGGCRRRAAWTAASPSATGPARCRNIMPEWQDLLFRGDWKGAYDILQETNNFPEFTGRVCPRPVRGVLRPVHQRRRGHHHARTSWR